MSIAQYRQQKSLCNGGGRTCFSSACSIGEQVLSCDMLTGAVAMQTVTAIMVKEANRLNRVAVSTGETITSTNNHPWYVVRKCWTLAESLQAGDRLVDCNGDIVYIISNKAEELAEPVKVYNLTVNDETDEHFHTYYVGESSILVHNACGANGVTNKEAEQAAKELGYKKVSGQSHSQAVFENRKVSADMRYITRDIDSHNGGFWKAADSIKNLGSKATRTGTFSKIFSE